MARTGPNLGLGQPGTFPEPPSSGNHEMPALRSGTLDSLVDELVTAGLTVEEIAAALQVPRAVLRTSVRADELWSDVGQGVSTLVSAFRLGERNGLKATKIRAWLKARDGGRRQDELRRDPGKLLYELWRFSVTSRDRTDVAGGDDPASSRRGQFVGKDKGNVPLSVVGEMTTWRVGRRIGQGGMSVVHEARSTEGHVGAVKLFSDHRFAEREEAVRRLSREAQHLRAIVHPGVVRVLDLGEVNGHPALILERATESLYDLLHASRRMGLAGALDLLVVRL